MSARPRYAITDLLPHRHELLLLETIEDYGEDWVRAGLVVRDTDLFCEPGAGVPAWVGIEYMAQAIGLYDGIDRLRRGLSPKIGLLLGSRKYASEVEAFAVGTALQVTARMVLLDDSALAVFDCGIADGVRVLARAEVKAFRPGDLDAMLKGQP